MSTVLCPQCHQLDRAESVRGLFESQTSHYSGSSTSQSVGWGYGSRVGSVTTFGATTTYTTGRDATTLAIALAPPPQPRHLADRAGPALVVLGLICAAILWFLVEMATDASFNPHPPALRIRQASVLFVLFGLPFLGGFVFRLVRWRRNKVRYAREYQENVAGYTAIFTVWQASMVCTRCHLAYVPPGTLPFPPGTPAVSPVPNFQRMVTDLAGWLR